MQSAQILAAILVGAGLAACGDDPATTPDGDSGAGASDSGSGSDAGSGSDSGDDTSTDTPTPDEICDDAAKADEDGDGDANCADSDCEDEAACQTPIEDCATEGDEDGDGAADGDDSDCAFFDDCQDDGCGGGPACEAGFECIGNACVANDQTPETYEPAANWSYISFLQVPENGGAAECCYDFTGDGVIDNGLSELLGLLGGLVGDIDTLLEDAFVEGTITLLAEYRADDLDAWKASPRLSFWLGTNDLDGDGAPDQDYDTRAGGDGIFRVENEVFTSTGAPIQFNTGTYSAGALSMDPSIFVLTLPLDSLIAGLGNLSLEIKAARLEATLDDVTPTLSIQEMIEDVEYGGAKLGGILPLAQVFEALDNAARTCTCSPEIDGVADVIVHGENEESGRYGAACAQASYDVSACDPETQNFCAELLNQICGYASVIAAIPLADLDTDGSGIADAITVGARLTMAPATLDAQWIETEGSGG